MVAPTRAGTRKPRASERVWGSSVAWPHVQRPLFRGDTVSSMPQTMFEKIWNAHVVTEGAGGQTLLYVDRHLLHEGSTSAFTRLEQSGRSVRRPDRCFATADHYLPTTPPGTP